MSLEPIFYHVESGSWESLSNDPLKWWGSGVEGQLNSRPGTQGSGGEGRRGGILDQDNKEKAGDS